MFSLLFIFLCYAFFSDAVIFHCDFETDCTDFTFDSNWGLTDGNHSQAIDHDHTLNTSAGHYRYYDPPSTPRFPLAQIQTTNWLQPSPNRTVCFYMWYYTPRLEFPFNIQTGEGEDERLAHVLFSMAGKKALTNDWTLINVTLPNEKLKIFIRLNVTGKPLAFDDLSVDYCDRPSPVPSKVLYSCDFESSCSENFVSLPDYPYEWSILSASNAVKIETAAPVADYTFGNTSGHYALLPNSKIVKEGYVGYLHLQTELQITSDESYCLNFQYYGIGDTYGEKHLQVYLWASDGSKSIQDLWPIGGSSQYPYTVGKWTWGIINLPIGNYSLLFRVDNFDSVPRTFALDNIAITSCDYPPYQPGSYSSLLSFSCSFDNLTMCDMVNSPTSSKGSFNFTQATGETIPDPQLGPKRDHTSNSTFGGFLYWNRHLPFSSEDSGVIFTSKTVAQNSAMCVKFAYYVNSTAFNRNGTTIGVYEGGCFATGLWSQSLDDSEGWQTAIAPVRGSPCAETIYFYVNQPISVRVSVAFDDVEVNQCSILIPTTTTTYTTTIVTTTRATTSTSYSTTATTTTTTSSSSTTTSVSTTVTTTPSSAHQLLALNRCNLITMSFLWIISRK